jgi:hypothetical protein
MTWLYFVLVQSVFVFVGQTLAMDDDVLVSHSLARCIFEEWRRDPTRIVGVLADRRVAGFTSLTHSSSLRVSHMCVACV